MHPTMQKYLWTNVTCSFGLVYRGKYLISTLVQGPYKSNMNWGNISVILVQVSYVKTYIAIWNIISLVLVLKVSLNIGYIHALYLPKISLGSKTRTRGD